MRRTQVIFARLVSVGAGLVAAPDVDHVEGQGAKTDLEAALAVPARSRAVIVGALGPGIPIA